MASIHNWFTSFKLTSELILSLLAGKLTMESPEIAAFARNFAVMVRISVLGLKFRRHAFHHHESGKTTLSDTLLERDHDDLLRISALIVTSRSLVEPFLPADCRSNGMDSGKSVKSIHGAQIDVLTEFDDEEI